MNKIVEQGFGMVITMDTEITPELYIEGLKNDLIRYIQDFRKEIKLNITDKIEFYFYGVDCDKIKRLFIEEIEKTIQGKINMDIKGESKRIELGGENIGLIIAKV